MSEPGKAVFLSYASQDAEAAKRICDALRQAGVEVWFDAEGGLEHGDEWDAKIRRQIKECVLFIAVISANTQAREEGYFRIEWELAAQRALGIASGVAFILPVVIDATREPAALVPDRFRTVQWTRLPGGNVPSDVLQRFLKLWSHRTGAVAHQAAQSSAAPDNLVASPAPRRRVAVAAWGVAVLAVALAGGAFFLFHPTADQAPARAVPVAAPAPEPFTEARKLAQRARAVFDATTVVRQDMELAEQLVQKAEALDPTDAYVWAVAAQVDAGFVLFAYDSSDTRAGQALSKADRALKMAPVSFEARLAKAFVLTYALASGSKISPEAGRLAEALLKEQPANRRVLLIQGMIMQGEGRWEEAVNVYRLAHDRWAEGWALLYAGRLAEATAVAEAGFKAGQAAADPVAGAGDVRQALMLLLSLNLRAREDLKATQAVIGRMPPDELREDETACYAADVCLMQHQPEKVLEIMRALPRDWLVPRSGGGPYKAVYSALAQQMANHPDAAGIEWRAALNLVEERLAARPNAPELVLWKAFLLAHLGERSEATRLLQLFEQLQGRHGGEVRWDSIETYLVLDRREEVMTALPKLLQDPFARFWFHAYLRYDPRYDSLRSDPRFEKFLRETMPKTAQPFPEQRTGDGGPRTAPAPQANDKSVAVLAFANLSDDKANEYFSDGISEELLNVLCKVPGLKVTARTSSFYFKGKEVPIPEIAQQLGVAYVVEGSVRKQGDKVRITAQLIKADGGFHVWSDTFTRDLKDIFAVQDEIAGLIARNLQLKIDATVERESIRPEVYELLLQARAQAQRESTEGRKQAIELYRRALAAEPRLAAAWAEMAHAYMGLGRFGGLPIAEGMREARAAAQQALSLDPDQPVGLDTLAWVQRTADWDWRGALRSFERAMALAPGDPGIRVDAAVLYFNIGRVEEAIALARQTVERDPLNVSAQFYLGVILEIDGRWEESLGPLKRAVELAPAADEFHTHVARALISLGRLAEAEKFIAAEPNEGYRLVGQTHLRWAAGDRKGALKSLDELITKYGAEIPGYVALASAVLGDKEQAFAWLDRAVARRDAAVAWIKTNYYLRSLHGDRRWNELLSKLGLADEQLK